MLWMNHEYQLIEGPVHQVRPAVYGRFIDVLCKDLVMGNPSSPDSVSKASSPTLRNCGSHLPAQPFADQSPALARRLGFAALPVGCLIVRVIFQTIEMLADTSHIDECAPPRKLAVGRGLLSYLSIGPEGQARIINWLVFLVILAILWAW